MGRQSALLGGLEAGRADGVGSGRSARGPANLVRDPSAWQGQVDTTFRAPDRHRADTLSTTIAGG